MMDYHWLIDDTERYDTEVVDDYEMGDFDLTVFWDGKRFDGVIPDTVRLFILEEHPPALSADLLYNPVSWVIVSERLLDLLWPMIRDEVQVFDAPVFRQSGEKVSRYKLLNPILLLDCIDEQRSTPPRPRDEETHVYFDLWIHSARVGGHHIFRCKGSPYDVVVSGALARSLVGKGMRGVAFIRLGVS